MRRERPGDQRSWRPSAEHAGTAAEHLIAGGEAGDAVADRQDGAGDLAAEHRRAVGAVEAFAHPPVARIHPGRAHPHQQLTRSGHRLRDLQECLLLPPADPQEPVTPHTHPCPSASGSGDATYTI